MHHRLIIAAIGKWVKHSPHHCRPNIGPAMATARICVLFVVLTATLAKDVKLKYKSTTKPVRLFTEEELKRYDGSEVNFVCKPRAGWVFVHPCMQVIPVVSFPPCCRKESPSTWQWRGWCSMSPKEKVQNIMDCLYLISANCFDWITDMLHPDALEQVVQKLVSKSRNPVRRIYSAHFRVLWQRCRIQRLGGEGLHSSCGQDVPRPRRPDVRHCELLWLTIP